MTNDVDIEKYLRLTRTRYNRHHEAAEEIHRLRMEVERLTKELNGTKIKCLYWREIALENQTNG